VQSLQHHHQEAIRALFRVMNRYVGSPQPMPGVFPDYPAPVLRNAGTERELVTMRCGRLGNVLDRPPNSSEDQPQVLG